MRVLDAVRVAPEPLPREPAHRRRPREAVVQGEDVLPPEGDAAQKDDDLQGREEGTLEKANRRFISAIKFNV